MFFIIFRLLEKRRKRHFLFCPYMTKNTRNTTNTKATTKQLEKSSNFPVCRSNLCVEHRRMQRGHISGIVRT